MGYQTLKSKNNASTVFEGYAEHENNFIEELVNNRQRFRDVRLDKRNLSHINLDGGVFENVDFGFSNLNGANLSDCVFKNCSFRFCSMVDSCANESNFQNCDFSQARLTASDFCYARLTSCTFTLPAYSFGNLHRANAFKNCRFLDVSGQTIVTSSAPIEIHGFLSKTIFFIGNVASLGDKIFNIKDLPSIFVQQMFSRTKSSKLHI